MRILFMGTPDFSVSILKKILQSGHDVIGVVTQPDKQKGRGKAMCFSPVKELANAYQLPVYQPVKVKNNPEFIQTVRELAPEVIIVAAFGQILPKDLLDIPAIGCICVHSSLLPKYRGAAPIQYSIIDGEEKTGVTIIHMDVGIDTGDIILQAEIPIAPDETGGTLFDKLADLGADLLMEALVKLEAGTAVRTPQDNANATYVKVLDKKMGNVDFTMPAQQLERLIRGLNPWPSAYTFINGKTLKLWKASVEQSELMGTPGQVMEIRKDAIAVMTGKDLLVIRELQLEGKNRMSAEAFLRGYPVPVGMKLGEQI